MKNEHHYCLILAGGKGRRLWPVSREERPKQFLDIFGMGKSLLQLTYERFLEIIPEENILVSTYVDYVDLVYEQLPMLKPENLFVEPIRRNTAPIVAWATHRLETRDKDAAFIVSPADQMIQNEKTFYEDMLVGMEYVASQQCMLAMAIAPTRPEPGYGYIQKGDTQKYSDFYSVKSFTEKPEREFAEMFIESGEFLWNTGLFICTAKAIRERLCTLLPSVMRSLDAEKANATWQEEEDWIQTRYTAYPNMSLENGILERCTGVSVKECRFGWMDVGSWHGIYEASREYEGANVILNTNASITDSQGNIISLPKGHIAVVNGLDNFIIAEYDDVLLITPRDDTSSQVIKQLNQYDLRKG